MSVRKSLLALATAVSLVGSGYVAFSARGLKAPSSVSLADSVRGKSSSSTRIQLEHADELNYDASIRADAQRLIGNVRLRHGTAVMTCDSAYLFEESQSFEAFGNVQMVQNDTIKAAAKHLYYDGRSRVAQLRENVVLENPSTQLYTDHLDYDRVSDIAYYFNGGSVVDAQNTLTSEYGEFRPATNDAEFRTNVKLVNDSTTMTTEHLFYNTTTRIARYIGQTHIASDSGYIISTRGVYDLNNDVGILLDRSQLYSGAKMLTGDSIYYDGIAKRGEAFGQMEIADTAQHIRLFGDYGFFDDGRNYAFASSRAYALDYSQPDTLYVGADTLELISLRRAIADSLRPKVSRLDQDPRREAGQVVRDSVSLPMPSDSIISSEGTDSLQKLADTLQPVESKVEEASDSLSRMLRAYSRVRIYRRDAQAVADSMSYSSIDSVLSLYRSPMMWSEGRQVSGDTIVFLFRSRKLERVDILANAVAVEKIPKTTDYYNQLQGERIYAYMQDSAIREMIVDGDSIESVFYLQEEGGEEYIGLDRRTSKRVHAWFENKAVQKVLWRGPVAGKAYPLAMATAPEVNRLARFNWSVELRPSSGADVIPPLDTLLIPEYNLTNLKRFDGAKAALKAYEPYEKKSDEVKLEDKQPAEDKSSDDKPSADKTVAEPSTQTESQRKRPLYYVWQELPAWHPTQQQTDPINLQWLYKDSTDREVPASLITNLSTGTPARKS